MMNVPFSPRRAAFAISISAFLILIALTLAAAGLVGPLAGSPSPSATPGTGSTPAATAAVSR